MLRNKKNIIISFFTLIIGIFLVSNFKLMYEGTLKITIGHLGNKTYTKNNTVTRYDYIESAKDLSMYIDETYINTYAFTSPGYGKYVIIKSYCEKKSICLDSLSKLKELVKNRHNTMTTEKISFMNSEKKIILDIHKNIKSIKSDNAIVNQEIYNYINKSNLHLKKLNILLSKHLKTSFDPIVISFSILSSANFNIFLEILFMIIIFSLYQYYLKRPIND